MIYTPAGKMYTFPTNQLMQAISIPQRAVGARIDFAVRMPTRIDFTLPKLL